MAVALRINPRFLLPRNPSAALSSAAAAAAETSPPHLAAGSPETTETPPSPPPDPAGCPSPRKALDKLKSAIRSESDPDRLAALFESAAQHKHFHSDPRFYPLTVQKLARARRPDLIKRLLNNSTSDPAIPQSDGFIARIINLYSTAIMPGQAISTFHRAVSAGHPLAERSLCALLSAFLKAGELDRAVEAFDNIPKQLNLTPGLVAHNILLQILCKKGDVAAARKLLDEMSNTDCAKPDIISYTTVLDGYLSKDDEAGFDEILDVIDRAGLVASVVTYNCRITFFCRKKEMVKAEEVLDEMAAKRVTPNRASFKNLIEGFYKVDDMGSALRVFKRMKMLKRKENMNNLVPDADTYNMLIGGLVRKGEFGLALEVCKECLARKLIPPFELVKRLADGLKGTSKDDEAKDIVERMRAVVKAAGAIDAWKKVEKELCLSPAVIKQEGMLIQYIIIPPKMLRDQPCFKLVKRYFMESTAFHPASSYRLGRLRSCYPSPPLGRLRKIMDSLAALLCTHSFLIPVGPPAQLLSITAVGPPAQLRAHMLSPVQPPAPEPMTPCVRPRLHPRALMLSFVHVASADMPLNWGEEEELEVCNFPTETGNRRRGEG